MGSDLRGRVCCRRRTIGRLRPAESPTRVVFEEKHASRPVLSRFFAVPGAVLSDHAGRPWLTRCHVCLDDRTSDEWFSPAELDDVLADQAWSDDVREFARLDESDLSEVDVNAGIESTVNIIRNRAHDKQVKIELHLAPVPGLVCYPAKINQVVMNLLSNAIDASSPGSAVIVRTRENNETLEIEVADSGSGIDPAIRSRIFDPFFTTKPPGQGTGLGLSISYGIVKEHSGTIEVRSTPGKGTSFHLEFPVSKNAVHV